MKFSSVSTIILISSILLIAPIQCHLQQPSMIEDICQTTPHYQLCVMTLKAQQLVIRDVEACARVMIKVMIVKAPIILQRINILLGEGENQNQAQNQPPQMKTALQGCSTSYTQISKELLPKALNCMEKQDYNGAKESASAASQLAASCASSTSSASTSTSTGTSTGTGTGTSTGTSTGTGTGTGTGFGFGIGTGTAGKGATSPLGDSNQYLKNMCDITVSIITKMSQSAQQSLH